MTRSVPRRLGALTAAIALGGALLAPGLASAATDAPASASSASSRSSAASADGIQVRQLDDACPRGRVPATRFRDTPGSVFERAVDCLVWYEVTEGRTPTAFDPNLAVNRRQMAVFLHRLLDGVLDLPTYDGASRFRDVPDDGFGSAEINVLASDELAERLGVRIVSGRSAREFDPGARVTREQMGSFVARTLEGVAHAAGGRIEPGDCGGPCFRDDARISPTHLDNVHLLFQFGIVTGRSNGAYDPKGDVSRGQMALFLTRSLDVLVEARLTLPPDERG